MTEVNSPPPQIRELGPFLWIALGWLGVAGIGAYFLSPREILSLAEAWTMALWALCVLDLLALAKAVAALLGYLSLPEGNEKRFPLLIHASYWGLLKLACLGIFTFVLFHGRTIPNPALILGTGTLVVVPLIGGFWWSFHSIKE